MNPKLDNLRKSSRCALREGNFSKAEQLCKQLWEAERRASDLSNYLQALLRQNKSELALKTLEGLDKELARHSHLCQSSAAVLRASGRSNVALSLLEEGLSLHKEDKNLRLTYVRHLLQLKKFEEARQSLELLHLQGAKSFSISFNLGFALSNLQRFDEALSAFEEAQRYKPDHAITAANRITLLKDGGRVLEARELFNTLPDAIDRSSIELLGAEAGLLMAEQEFWKAANVLKPLCQKHPELAQNWLNLAASLRGMKLNHSPDRILRRSLQWHPKNNDLQQAWLQSLSELGLSGAARRLLEQMDLKRIARKDLHLFNMLFLAVSGDLAEEKQIKDIVEYWEQQRQSPHLNKIYLDHICISSAKSERRLRIGYLSSDYCNHPVGRFLLPVLQHHNRKQVEVWGLHSGPHWDEISVAIQNQCDHWLDLRNLDDRKAARVIADQRLDILIELGGFSGNSRIGICVHRPAAVQMSYLGYPGATYLKCLPWWIGDHTLFSKLEYHASTNHKLATVKGGYMTLPRPDACGEVKNPTHGRLRFGSFNHARKITDSTITLWCKVMQACSKAELILKSFTFQNQDEQMRIRKRFRQEGLDVDRLILLPAKSNFHEHLQTYNSIDVALDPVPYGGATTTAEALWMGVPVLCLNGQGMAANLAASVLNSANCSEWIHSDSAAYVKTAQDFMREGPRSKEKREALVERIKKSGFNEPRRVSAELERIYKEAIDAEF